MINYANWELNNLKDVANCLNDTVFKDFYVIFFSLGEVLTLSLIVCLICFCH